MYDQLIKSLHTGNALMNNNELENQKKKKFFFRDSNP